MAAAVPVMMAASTAMSAMGSLQEGKAADQAAKNEDRQLQEMGKQEFGMSSQRAYEAGRQGRVAQSDQEAAMAASGGTTTDPGSIRQRAKTKQVAEFNVLSELYDGAKMKSNRDRQAAARRAEGKNAKKASRIKAFSTALGGGAKAYSAYKDL